MDVNTELDDRGFIVVSDLPSQLPPKAVLLRSSDGRYFIARPQTVEQLEVLAYEVDGSELVYNGSYFILYTDNMGMWIGSGGENVKAIARSIKVHYLEIARKPLTKYRGVKLGKCNYGTVISIAFRRGAISAVAMFEKMLRSSQLMFVGKHSDQLELVHEIATSRKWNERALFKVQITSDFCLTDFHLLEPGLESINVHPPKQK